MLSHQAFLSLPPARLQILHTQLLEPSLSFTPCKPLNPSSLFPAPDPEAEHLSHDCVQTLDMSLNPFEHITYQLTTDTTVPSWFIDGSAQNQVPFGTGYAVVQGQPDKDIPPRLIKSATPPAHTSSQQAELIALTQALTIAKNQKGNIYTDSKYVYNILHFNIIIWRERGFLTQKGTPILSAYFISELLHVAQLPKQAAIIHCQGHQQHGPISFYNNVAGQEAKPQAASVSPVFTVAQIDEPNIRTLLLHLHSLFHPSTKVLKTFLQNFIELTKDDTTYLNNLTKLVPFVSRQILTFTPLLSPPTKFAGIFPHKTGN